MASHFLWSNLLPAAIAITLVNTAAAQLPYGKLDWVFPPGGQSGTEFSVTIGGTDLDVADALFFSHPGISARQAQTAPTEFEPARPIDHQFTVRIADYVPPGIYEVRALGRFGVSTPRAFQVGTLPERNELVDNLSSDMAMELSEGETINGRANGNAADFYRIRLSKDQPLLIQLDAFEIDSQMDATLTIFDASGHELMTSRDQNGRDTYVHFVAPNDGEYLIKVFDFTYLGGNNHFYRLSTTDKPVIDFVFPPAIEPGKTATVTLYGWNLPGSTPHPSWTTDGRPIQGVDVSVTAPLADPLGKTALPLGAAMPYAVDLAGFRHPYQTGDSAVSQLFVGLAQAPVVREQAENNGASSAQVITPPCEVAGQFFPARDDDWFEFTGSKDDVWVLEVLSQRHGVPSDPFLLVQRVSKNADGTEQVTDVAEVDDGSKRPGGRGYDKPAGDPTFRLAVSEDGTYRVLVRDLLGQSRARPRNFYRLAIRREKPDYHLLVTTQSPFNPDPNQPMRWNPVLRRGGTIALTVSVVRVDGFSEPIELMVAGLPENVTAPRTTIGPNRDSGVLTIRADENAASWTGPFEITGTAERAGRTVMRSANFATLVWDTPAANAKMTPRLTVSPLLQVSSETAPLLVNFASDGIATVARGAMLTIPFSLTKRGELKDKINLAAVEVPTGVKTEIKLPDDADQGELLLTVEPNAPLGVYSLCLTGKIKVVYHRLPDRIEVAENERKAVETRVNEIATAQATTATALAAAENQFNAHTELLASANASLAALLQQENVSDEQRAAAQQQVDAAQKQIGTTTAAKESAAATATTLQQRHAAAQEALKRLADRVAQITENAKPSDRDFYVASNPVTLQIVDAPAAEKSE